MRKRLQEPCLVDLLSLLIDDRMFGSCTEDGIKHGE
jgi:hypothetical protein